MSSKQDQRQPHDPSHEEPRSPGTGEGSDSALWAMLKKRREAGASPDEAQDPGDESESQG
jgi:hypothetical protein